MTGFSDVVFAVVVALVLNLAIATQVGARLTGESRAWVLRTFWWSLLPRLALAMVLNSYAADSGFAAMFWGDSSTYDAGGYSLKLFWTGEAVGTPQYGEILGRYGFYYFVGAIYYLFGRNQLLVQFVNGTIGSLTMLVMYALARRLFGDAVARRVALMMAFFPGMIFWSAGMYKDPAILLCIAVSMYSVVRLREAISPSMLLLFTGAVVALATLRFYISYFVVFATLGSFVFSSRGAFLQRMASYCLLLAALVGGLNVGLRERALERQNAMITLEQLQLTRRDQAALGQSAFGQEYDVSTPAGAIRALPVGLVYLLFAPFPWAIAGARQALVLPEMLVWYGLMPAFVAGLAYGVRKQLGDVLPILVFAVSLMLAYALMQGNVGTAYRQRTQVTMFFFLFMGLGLERRARVKQEVAGLDRRSENGRRQTPRR
jgi:hypothetical protein